MEATANRDLVEELQSRAGLSADQAKKAYKAIVATIKEELLRGNPITLDDFATLRVTERRAQIVKDPETGHQYIEPARNVVAIDAREPFASAIEKVKLSSIILAVPSNDPFAQVIQFHFSRVDWRVHIVNTIDECLEMLETGAYLVIVDYGLEGSMDLVKAIKAQRATSLVPLITLYPSDRDPDRCPDFLVLGDDHLVEPFEVYNLLMLAESELARSSEEEVIFEQQLQFQFGSRRENLERAVELGEELFEGAGLKGDPLDSFKAAFREACANAMAHGNDDDPDKLVKVLFLLDKEKITLVVRDEGQGFDFKAAIAALEGETSGERSGLGIMLMRKCSDELEYDDVGNTLTLTKYIDR